MSHLLWSKWYKLHAKEPLATSPHCIVWQTTPSLRLRASRCHPWLIAGCHSHAQTRAHAYGVRACCNIQSWLNKILSPIVQTSELKFELLLLLLDCVLYFGLWNGMDYYNIVLVKGADVLWRRMSAAALGRNLQISVEWFTCLAPPVQCCCPTHFDSYQSTYYYYHLFWGFSLFSYMSVHLLCSTSPTLTVVALAIIAIQCKRKTYKIPKRSVNHSPFRNEDKR